MRKTLLMTTGLAWLALTGAAGAAIVTVQVGPQNPQYFASLPINQSNFVVNGDTWSDRVRLRRHREGQRRRANLPFR